jgi:hypothetical protein
MTLFKIALSHHTDTVDKSLTKKVDFPIQNQTFQRLSIRQGICHSKIYSRMK